MRDTRVVVNCLTPRYFYDAEMVPLGRLFRRFAKEGLYTPLNEQNEKERKQIWINQSCQIIDGILQNLLTTGSRDDFQPAQVNEWCKKAVEQLPEEYCESIETLLSTCLLAIVEHSP